MDVFEAVDSRISCRWFLDKPVDQNIVRALIAKGGARRLRRQSAAVARLRADRRAARRAQAARSPTHIAGHDPRHDDAEYPIYPNPIWKPLQVAREEHGVQLYGALDIARDDAGARLDQYKRNFQFFNAPVALFVTIERQLGPGQWADLGSYLHTLMYLARGYGLDTCPQESWARMHRIVGAVPSIPPAEHMLFCARGDRLRRPSTSRQQLPLAARRARRVLHLRRIRSSLRADWASTLRPRRIGAKLADPRSRSREAFCARNNQTCSIGQAPMADVPFACSPWWSPPGRAASSSQAFAQNTRIRVAYTASDAYAAAMVAKDRGMFANRGLDVELRIEALRNFRTMPAALHSGSVDIAGRRTPVFLQAIDGGIDLMAIIRRNSCAAQGHDIAGSRGDHRP